MPNFPSDIEIAQNATMSHIKEIAKKINIEESIPVSMGEKIGERILNFNVIPDGNDYVTGDQREVEISN